MYPLYKSCKLLYIFCCFFLHSIILHAVWLKMSKHVDLWSTNVESVCIIGLFLIQYNSYIMCKFQQNGCIYKSVDKHKKIFFEYLEIFSAKKILWISKLLNMFLAEWKWIKYRSLMHFFQIYSYFSLISKSMALAGKTIKFLKYHWYPNLHSWQIFPLQGSNFCGHSDNTKSLILRSDGSKVLNKQHADRHLLCLMPRLFNSELPNCWQAT